MLGAGGAARAAVFALKDKGAEVFILNRTAETAQKLARQAGAKVLKREALPKTDFDVLINATPVGMAGNKGAAFGARRPRRQLVFDLVYNPIETPLIRMARQKGIPYYRRRDVRAAGRAPVRDLDRQTGPGREMLVSCSTPCVNRTTRLQRCPSPRP